MKKRKRAVEKAKVGPPPAVARRRRWPLVALGIAALAATLAAYEPALNGPFVFDDSYLPFTDEGLARSPLKVWMMGVRPALMFTFWLNYRLSGLEPYSYHLLNVLLHIVTGFLAFLIARKFVSWAGEEGFRRDAMAAFAGGVFLLHPLQTESVSYVASRSEALSVMLFYAAFAVFLYRRKQAISWIESIAVLALFGAAVTTKEHAAVLPALLLLTDYFWNPGFSFQGIRRNWRLYGIIAVGAALAARVIWRVIASTDTAGFSLPEFTWQQYFFTQCRAIWTYLRMFVLPYGQSIDPDFPISRDLFAYAAVFGLVGLLAVTGAAFWYRRRFPLASYGWFAALILLAPTSSVMPILDPFAEHRVYLPMIAFILIALEFLRRWKPERRVFAAALAVVVAIFAVATWRRNHVWGDVITLWEDAVAKAPGKARPHHQLAFAYYAAGRCSDALGEYEKVGKLSKHDYRLLVNWAMAYDCVGQRDAAVDRLNRVPAAEKNAHVYSLIGLIYGRQSRKAEALDALATAIKLDPNYELSYVYRAGVHASFKEYELAAADYRRALAVNPQSEPALDGLARVEAVLKGSQR